MTVKRLRQSFLRRIAASLHPWVLGCKWQGGKAGASTVRDLSDSARRRSQIDIVAEDGKVKPGDQGAMAFAVQQHGNIYSSDQEASENDYSVAMIISLGKFDMFTGGDLTGSADGASVTHTIRSFGGGAKVVYTNVEITWFVIGSRRVVNRKSRFTAQTTTVLLTRQIQLSRKHLILWSCSIDRRSLWPPCEVDNPTLFED